MRFANLFRDRIAVPGKPPWRLAFGLAALASLQACDEGVPLVDVNVGIPTRLVVLADTSAFDDAPPGAVLPVQVQATDPYGSAVADAQVVWTLQTQNGASVAPETTRTDDAGRAVTTWILGTTAGAYELRGSAGSVATVDLIARVP